MRAPVPVPGRTGLPLAVRYARIRHGVVDVGSGGAGGGR